MKSIEIQSLATTDPGILENLAAALQETFGVSARINPQTIRIEQFYDIDRGQYNSTAILHHLDGIAFPVRRSKSVHLNDEAHIVGVTGEDLFIPILTYVFGEAALGGDVAVVSYHRFRNELYGLPSNRQLVQERLTKVAIHELGHSLGLVHCSVQYCVMHAASYVEELDLKGRGFCPFCRSAIMKSNHHLTSLLNSPVDHHT